MFRNNSAFNRLAKNSVSIEPLAVVLNFNNEVTALVISLQADRTFRRFSSGNSLFRKFNPVIHGIANHVQQRIANLIDNSFVELRVFPFCFQMNLLAKSMAEISYDASHLLERGSNRHHSQRETHFLQIANDFAQLNQCCRFHIRMEPGPVLLNHRRADHQLANLIDHLVEPIAIHTHRFA